MDWEVIKKLEGKAACTGYIPKDLLGNVIGNSGVTISHGIDIGQLSYEEYVSLVNTYAMHSDKAMLLDLAEDFAVYFGVKKEAAKELLKRRPLHITKEESLALYGMFQNKTFTQLREMLKKHTVDIYKVHSQAITVLLSLAWNFGVNLDLSIPNTFHAILKSIRTNNWVYAIAALEAFPSKQKELRKRRKIEASYLRILQESIKR